MSNTSSAAFADTKPHYNVLDGLRGVAAIVVLWYHVFEAFATNQLDQVVNHGYMAVDFFFILSGFVIGYAYDDRWKTMKTAEFIRRRVIRLHPMVVVGAVVGGISFCVQGCQTWTGAAVSVGALLMAVLLNAFLIPSTPGMEIRGAGETFPLNGPSWSLFFEYVGNLLYVFFIRKMSTGLLAVLVALAALGLGAFALFGPLGSVGAGWQLTDMQFTGGFLRLLFSFSAGLLLSRIARPARIKGAFWICASAIVLLMAMPRFGAEERLWMNGLYETLCVTVCFPLLVYVGACGRITNGLTARICRFLGDISYPVYMVHYPFIYLYFGWVKKNGLTFGQAWLQAVLLIVGSVILAYLCLKLYDEPVRRYLTKNRCFSKS